MDICIWPDGTRCVNIPVMPDLNEFTAGLRLNVLEAPFTRARIVDLHFDPRLNICWGRDDKTHTTHYAGL